MNAFDTTLREIRDGPSGARIGAFFDFDGTIIQGYSAMAFYRHRVRNFEIGPAEAVRTVLAALRRSTTAEQFERVAELGIRSWAGRAEEDLDRLGHQLLVEGIAGALFHDVWRLVRTHIRRGHTVVIASSATRFQVEPMARELEVQHVLCTPVEVEDGICTGRIAGPPLWGAAKADAVSSFADTHAVDLGASYAYANGDEDVDFLSTVGHPHAINPGPGLSGTATHRQWPVLQCESAKRSLEPLPVGRTAAMWGGFFASVGTGIGLGLLNRNRRQGVDLATSLWGQLAPALGDIRFDVQGAEHLWSHRPAVFLFNHQSSFMDLLISFRLLEREFTIVAKKEVAQLPIIGQLFGLADVAFVDRSNRAKAIEALKPLVQKLRSGISVAVSPEGTRSLTPTVGPFKKGAFRMAMEAGVPIVAVVVRNAGELMWRDSQIARSGGIDVVVHPPLPTFDWTNNELEKRIAEVRDLYVDTLDDWPVHNADGDKVR